MNRRWSFLHAKHNDSVMFLRGFIRVNQTKSLFSLASFIKQKKTKLQNLKTSSSITFRTKENQHMLVQYFQSCVNYEAEMVLISVLGREKLCNKEPLGKMCHDQRVGACVRAHCFSSELNCNGEDPICVRACAATEGHALYL